MPKKQKFMIVDGNAILHRAWHALPPMTTKKGVVVHAVYGFISIFFKALKDIKPEFVAVTFDRKEKTFRHEELESYKATRVKQPDELYSQIPIVKTVLEAMNIKIYEKAGFEADDVIGTLCAEKSVDRDDVLSVVVTGDLDTLQLVDDNTHIYTLHKGMSDTVVYDEKLVKKKFEGLGPNQMIDYKGLRGDPSDNISGVPGVGEKTAIALLQQFGSIEEIYKNAKAKEYKHIKITEKLYDRLMENKAKALQSKKLATIIKDVAIDFVLTDCALHDYDKKKVFDLFHELEFKSLLNRLPEFGAEEEVVKLSPTEKDVKHRYTHITDDKTFANFLTELKKQDIFAFDTETDSLDVFKCKLLGISFCWEDTLAYYVDARKEFLERLKPILENEKIKKVGHNLKFDVEVLLQNGIEVENLYFDTMIASYLLNPGTRAHKLDDLVFRELGYQMTAITDLIGKGKGQISMGFVEPKKVADYSCEDADYTWRLVAKLAPQMKKTGVYELFEKIEMPLVEVLIDMEMNGIKIDVAHLKKLRQKVQRKIDELTKKIYKQAGEEFNISSPQQMKVILFGKLQLSTEGIGKTKTGVSTAADELEKLRGLHPIIELIEEYRELSKLQSTYIEALPRLVCFKTGRVHTDYNQTITATGRLSSSNPNLQNIPTRTELGREIRRAFIAERGCELISADYSQIELRVIACLAKDKAMMNVFKRGEDIHTVTASKIFQVPLDKVTKEMRYDAKEVNFGVLYGMGAYGLSWRRKISRARAKEFIDKYFETYSRVKEYIEEMKADAREKGYVETLFGRRRYLPEINSGVQQIRASAERMAINMPIQGTAADLMKIAMIEVYRKLKVPASPPRFAERGRGGGQAKSRMLLQVHDELVLEVPKDQVDEVAKIIDEKMEKIHKLAVPIKVDTEAGKNWRDMEKLY